MLDDLQYKPEQRSEVLSDEAWAAALERAELKDTSASEICERLLQHYLALDEKPPQHGLPPEVTTRKRSIYVTSPPGRPRPRTKDVGTALHQCHP